MNMLLGVFRERIRTTVLHEMRAAIRCDKARDLDILGRDRF